jgi:transposase-like protein
VKPKSVNAIESLNARFRQATSRRGHFPTEQAALKVLYLVIRTPRKKQPNVTGKPPDGRRRSTRHRCTTVTASP